MRENYYEDKQLEFLTLIKPELTKDFTFLTLASEKARDSLLGWGLKFDCEKLKVSVTHNEEIGNTLELQVSITLVADNLPKRSHKP